MEVQGEEMAAQDQLGSGLECGEGLPSASSDGSGSPHFLSPSREQGGSWQKGIPTHLTVSRPSEPCRLQTVW